MFGIITLCLLKAADFSLKKEKRTSVYSILFMMIWTIQMCNSKQHLRIMAESVCVYFKYTNRGSVRLTVIDLHCYFLCLILHLCVLLNVSAEHFRPVSTVSQSLVVDRDWLKLYIIKYSQMTSATVFALYRFVCHKVDVTSETKWLKAIVIWLFF